MKAMMAQLSSENQAPQASKVQQQNQQPLQNITNQQKTPYPIPTGVWEIDFWQEKYLQLVKR